MPRYGQDLGLLQLLKGSSRLSVTILSLVLEGCFVRGAAHGHGEDLGMNLLAPVECGPARESTILLLFLAEEVLVPSGYVYSGTRTCP
jgi:hypothetical protein